MKKTILSVSIFGLLFSGYLAGTKLFTGSCALNESCPYFLGYPACFFGFLMFLAIAIFSVLYFLSRMESKKALTSIIGVASLGALFAGYFTLGELPLLFNKGFEAYLLGLPSCALGFFVYVFLIFISMKSRKIV